METQIYAEIITIGDEILYGQIMNTNTRFISRELDSVGFKTIRHTSVGDSEDQILASLAEAETRADVILITGGLGPTRDDITKKTLAKYFDSELAINETALAELTALLAYRGREVNGLNRLQALQPLKAKHVSNRIGTAPGMWFDRDGKVFISMPGVPSEMKEMLVKQVLPKLREQFKTPAIYHKVIRVAGIPESTLAEMISAWEDNLPPQIGLAYLPSYGQVKLRLTTIGQDMEVLKMEVAMQVEKLLPILGKAAYGEDEEELEFAIGKLLLSKNLTISCAESCTGGALSAAFTSVAGSSNYFKGAITVYSSGSKIDLLGVPAQLIDEHTVYSEETVAAMAKQVRTRFGTDIGVATSGVAGPPTENDPLPTGTIFIAFANADRVITKKLKFGTEREMNIKLTVLAVLNLIREQIQYIPHEQSI